MPGRSELKLTKRSVDTMSVETGDAIFWDRDLAGFCVMPGACSDRIPRGWAGHHASRLASRLQRLRTTTRHRISAIQRSWPVSR